MIKLKQRAIDFTTLYVHDMINLQDVRIITRMNNNEEGGSAAKKLKMDTSANVGILFKNIC
jgi:ribosomal silencing factor RsfS